MCRTSFLYGLLLTATMVPFIAGCSRGEVLGKVSGKVTFEGQPVSPAMITFASRDIGLSVLAQIDAEGKYKVSTAKGNGLPPGTYQVTIVPPLYDMPVGALQPPPPPRKFEHIPERYRSPETSGLSLKVNEGENPYDVAMSR